MVRRKHKRRQDAADASIAAVEASAIESYSSPQSLRTDENTKSVFSLFLFILVLVCSLLIWFAFSGNVDLWGLLAAFAIALASVLVIHIAPQWERAVVLRFGKFHKIAGPGLFATIPLVDHIALRVDQRVMLTGFGAEETLTSDLVPMNVDAAVFWMVWDAKKACLEVENYYNSVAIAAQTALRDAIGRKSVTDITVNRMQLDQELKDAIEEKTSVWGVSILFVEIRDIIIPKELQAAMAAEARAERDRDARMVLAEVEQDIASMLHQASEIYRDDEIALQLRQMHLLNENMKESKGPIVVPSNYADGFVAGNHL